MTHSRLEITKDFTFEAAHFFEHEAKDHPFARLHGHSFAGSVTLAGEPNDKGWIKDTWKIEQIVKVEVAKLDHRLLNEVEGLERPTLENICRWAAAQLQPGFPGLKAIRVSRPSNGETCIYDI